MNSAHIPMGSQRLAGGHVAGVAKADCARTGMVGIAAFLAIFMAGPQAIASATAATTLRGAQIERTIVGKRIYLATPFGGEFPMNYRAGGVVDGDGEALGLGRMVAPKDTGRWWIDGDRLCQQWREWYDGKAFCFTLQQTGPTSLLWLRDDGMKGSARIE
jgi:hypothetical protein